MKQRLKIDFVSDVSCPWCVIGLRSLERALAAVEGEIEADVHFHPFELNPAAPPAGWNSTEHLVDKYGTTPEQIDRNREAIRARGETLGFAFRMNRESRVYNTFDAHRLLHWAELEGRGAALEHALFGAYFSDREDVSDRETLVRIAAKAGLDATRARAVLDSDEYADAVRAREAYFTDRGIRAVPAVIVNDRHLIQGGQPPEVFEQALRTIAAGKAAA